MPSSLSRNLAVLVGVLVLGVVVGAILSGGLVRGQAPSGLAQQDQQLLDELVAKDEIREQIYNYSRGLDRMDMELAKQVWHPDGTTNIIGVFEGTGEGWIDWLWETHDPFDDEHPSRGGRGHSRQRDVHDGHASRGTDREQCQHDHGSRALCGPMVEEGWALGHRPSTVHAGLHVGNRVNRAKPVGAEPPRPDGPLVSGVSALRRGRVDQGRC